MGQKALLKKKGIEDWHEFKDRRFLGWKKGKTKQLFFNPKGMGIWHKKQRKLCLKNKGVILQKLKATERRLFVSKRGVDDNF